MTYNIAVCDDSTADTEYISSLVKRWADGSAHRVKTAAFPSAEAFLFAYEHERQYDIILLDIEMGKMNGLELAKVIRERDANVQLVFITGFPDYIAEGYDVAALHYLLKPVSYEKLSSVLDRAAGNISKAEKTFAVACGGEVRFVRLSDIYYIEAQKQYVLIHAKDGDFRMKMPLSDVAGSLDEYFYRCQRSFIVNLYHVARIKKDAVTLKNGVDVPIRRGTAEAIGKEMIRLF